VEHQETIRDAGGKIAFPRIFGESQLPHIQPSMFI